MPGHDPGIHADRLVRKEAWIAGSSPAMTSMGQWGTG